MQYKINMQSVIISISTGCVTSPGFRDLILFGFFVGIATHRQYPVISFENVIINSLNMIFI